jgi:general secretion pathway protein M
MKASPSPFDSFQRLEPRERRVIAVGAIVSAVLLATIWVIVPFAQHWASREGRLSAARERWTRLTTLVASTGHLRQTLDVARHASAGDSDRLAAGTTPALAASTLQELVQHDASQSAVQLERVDAAGEPHADKPGLLAIPVQLQARGNLYGLVDFLARLEHGSPLLVVDELTIDAGLDAADAAAVDDAPRRSLMWTVRLHGLYEGPTEGSQSQ